MTGPLPVWLDVMFAVIAALLLLAIGGHLLAALRKPQDRPDDRPER
jgi:hypothetical protein